MTRIKARSSHNTLGTLLSVSQDSYYCHKHNTFNLLYLQIPFLTLKNMFIDNEKWVLSFPLLILYFENLFFTCMIVFIPWDILVKTAYNLSTLLVKLNSHPMIHPPTHSTPCSPTNIFSLFCRVLLSIITPIWNVFLTLVETFTYEYGLVTRKQLKDLLGSKSHRKCTCVLWGTWGKVGPL